MGIYVGQCGSYAGADEECSLESREITCCISMRGMNTSKEDRYSISQQLIAAHVLSPAHCDPFPSHKDVSLVAIIQNEN